MPDAITRVTPDGTEAAGRRGPWRRLGIAALIAALVLVTLVLLVTSGSPWVEAPPAPSAQQVGAGRDAVLQLRASRVDPRGHSDIDFGPAQLDGVSALASHGFRPDRLRVELDRGVLRARGSHQLPLGRWLNVELATRGRSAGFPDVRLTVGAFSLGNTLSRQALELARMLLRWRHVQIPPLDKLVSRVVVSDQRVTATVSLLPKSGLVDQFAGAMARPVDPAVVARIYCGLATEQRQRPSGLLVDQLHRAFARPAPEWAAADYNRAAFIALAMLLVDERAADLAPTARNKVQGCRIDPIAASLHGRGDLPKHWALSAALSAGAGTQLSEAMGEWKELADSLSRQAQFAVGDPSGFSFVDLATDRVGFRVAQAAMQADGAEQVAGWLAQVSEERLLPTELSTREDGLSNAEFVARYGSLSDPRFTARVAGIDAVLDRAGVPQGR